MKTATGALLGLLLFAGALARAENVLTVEFPPPTATFRPGPGVELAQANCALCHSADYLSNQPPFGRAFWKDTVEKMRKNYGAPIPPEKVEPITDYLVRAYGVEK